MPFTLSHPAAVIPFRSVLPLSALVVGSMSPDIEYLFRLRPVSTISHTILGLFLFCLPVGLILHWLIFHYGRGALLVLLPKFLQNRIDKLPDSRLGISNVPCGILLGAFTHLCWDSFTHKTGWVVQQIPALSNPLFANFQVFNLLQYFSGIIGAAIIVSFFIRWIHRTPELPSDQRPIALTVRLPLGLWFVVVSIVGGLILGVDGLTDFTSNRAIHIAVVRVAVSTMATMLCLIVIWTFAWRIITERTKILRH